MDKTYSHNEYCDNCGKMSSFSIPKGTTIEYFMRNQVCSYCGCLLRDNKVEIARDRDFLKDLDDYLDRNPGISWRDTIQNCRHSQELEPSARQLVDVISEMGILADELTDILSFLGRYDGTRLSHTVFLRWL